MRLLVVYKKTAYEVYQQHPERIQGGTLRAGSPELSSLLASHDAHHLTLEHLASVLDKMGFAAEYADRDHIQDMIKDKELVITVGGDGTVIDASHYIASIPLLGLNSDPRNSVGHFCTASSDTIEAIISTYAEQPRTRLPRLALTMNGRLIASPVLNDFLMAHQNPASTTRFRLAVDGMEKSYKGNSGLLVCAASGSTAWMYQEGGEVMPMDDLRIQYLIRGQRNMHSQFAEHTLDLFSLTGEGKLYLDGDHEIHD
ncbi:MAG TPA: NAD(+)/NADH kinase, partial [Candidatus Nanoarchaeia archaeon]|nr:NAD(+)/NADH kinase [Candidatus Nanoarchaeia archaeon]